MHRRLRNTVHIYNLTVLVPCVPRLELRRRKRFAAEDQIAHRQRFPFTAPL